MRRPVTLEKSEQNLGHTKNHEPPRSRAHTNTPPHEVCDNLINALKLLARSRLSTTEDVRKFINMDNHEAIRIGDLENRRKSRLVVRPSLPDVQEAVVPEGTDELTPRREEEGMPRTFDSRWKSPLVDEEWHAICQAIYKGVEGQEWDVKYYKYAEMHKAINRKKWSGNKKAKALWSMRDVGKRCGRSLWKTP